MDVMEKLVELIGEVYVPIMQGDAEVGRYTVLPCEAAAIADHLIAHGVTVQSEKDINVPTKWIPMTERLPDKPMKCLVYTKRGDCGGYDISYYNQGFYSQYANVTHWMPLPEPPKDGV